jgi:hypothetical protein
MEGQRPAAAPTIEWWRPGNRRRGYRRPHPDERLARNFFQKSPADATITITITITITDGIEALIAAVTPKARCACHQQNRPQPRSA